MSELELLIELGESLDSQPASLGDLYLREYLAARLLRIRDRRGRLLPLAANPAQRAYERAAARRNIVLKSRQLGVTTWIAARFFLATITRPGTLTVQVAHDQDSAEEIFRIVHRYLANLPEWLREGALLTSRANVRQIVFPRLDSEYRVETAADPNAGRGLTIQNLHCSEVARWPGDAAQTLASLRAAVPAGGEVVLESTPNGAAGCFYQEWQRAPQTGYVRHFFPWWWEPSYRKPAQDLSALTAEEHELMLRYSLDREQIAFRREIAGSFRSLARQEFAEDPESCFLASGECIFDAELLERRLAELRADAPQTEESKPLTVFWPPRPGRSYILGVDPAGGGADGDYACVQVIERTTGMQCAELHAHLSPRELAQQVARMARRYNQALVAVERNNHGHAVLAYLVTAEGYGDIYEHGGQAGWPTNAATRPQMIANLAAVLASAPELFFSPRLLRECRTFVRHSDGNSRAASGAHDDCVMAMAIALEVRRRREAEYSRNGTLQVESLPLAGSSA